MLAAMLMVACQQTQQNQSGVNVIATDVPTEAVEAEELSSSELRQEESQLAKSEQQTQSQFEKKIDKKSKVVTESAKTKPATPKPIKARKFEPKKPGFRVAQVNVPGNYVALTFDDGPSSAYTPQVLDILKRHGARATFFVVGENAVRNKSILARAVAEGHEIANHTYTHIKMTTAGRRKVASEIERTSAIIKEATGYYPTAMRPPFGSINSELVDMMYSNYGMHAVLWDVDTRDWQHPGVNTVIDRAVNKSQPGSIILLHDIHASTLAAVEGVVTGLQARGFKLVTVSQLIEMGRRAAAPAKPVEPVAPAVEESAAPTEALPGGADITGSSETQATMTAEEPLADETSTLVL